MVYIPSHVEGQYENYHELIHRFELAEEFEEICGVPYDDHDASDLKTGESALVTELVDFLPDYYTVVINERPPHRYQLIRLQDRADA